MFTNIICPVSEEKIDSNVSRLTVFINAALMIAFLVTLQPILIYIVTIDCGIRAVGYNSYSPISKLSSLISKVLKWETKMIDKAPKMFSSRLGFICALLGSAFITFNMQIASMAIIGLFTVLALLDSVVNFCVGCIIYHHLVFPFYKGAN